LVVSKQYTLVGQDLSTCICVWLLIF